MIRVAVNYTLTLHFSRFYQAILHHLPLESEDYLSISEELQLSPSSSILFCVDVPILEDNAVENTETFSVLLNSNDSVVNITAGFATVTITDNDSKQLPTKSTYLCGLTINLFMH